MRTSTRILFNLSGTLLLSEVLTRLPTLPLTSGSLTSLSDFYWARIQDWNSIAEVLKGTLALVTNYAPFPAGQIEKILRTYIVVSFDIPCRLFSEVHVQSLPQSARKTVCDIFGVILQKHLSGKFSAPMTTHRCQANGCRFCLWIYASHRR